MTLHDRGQHAYKGVLVYIKREKSCLSCTPCTNCTHRHCMDCNEHEAFIIDDFANSVVHKFYYALYKMAKSYLTKDINVFISHNWENNENAFLKLLKKSRCTAQQKRECAEIIEYFTVQMSILRNFRNESDYNFFDFQTYLFSSINAAKLAYKYFSQMQTYLGDPKC